LAPTLTRSGSTVARVLTLRTSAGVRNRGTTDGDLIAQGALEAWPEVLIGAPVGFAKLGSYG